MPTRVNSITTLTVSDPAGDLQGTDAGNVHQSRQQPAEIMPSRVVTEEENTKPVLAAPKKIATSAQKEGLKVGPVDMSSSEFFSSKKLIDMVRQAESKYLPLIVAKSGEIDSLANTSAYYDGTKIYALYHEVLYGGGVPSKKAKMMSGKPAPYQSLCEGSMHFYAVQQDGKKITLLGSRKDILEHIKQGSALMSVMRCNELQSQEPSDRFSALQVAAMLYSGTYMVSSPAMARRLYQSFASGLSHDVKTEVAGYFIENEYDELFEALQRLEKTPKYEDATERTVEDYIDEVTDIHRQSRLRKIYHCLGAENPGL